jgi:hypothetical protein
MGRLLSLDESVRSDWPGLNLRTCATVVVVDASCRRLHGELDPVSISQTVDTSLPAAFCTSLLSWKVWVVYPDDHV